MDQPNAAFCLLDMCTKLYKHIDPTNLSKFKALTLLGSLLDRAGSTNEMQMVHKSVFKALEDVSCFERVFATRNYGYLLAAKEATRLEGKDYIKKADEMAKEFPYWAERRMFLFVPAL